ncbi:TPA: hypothetical protein O0770_002080 [Staphylococcus aureus]|nr:hypothetical protein [Staphylococcus aureus]
MENNESNITDVTQNEEQLDNSDEQSQQNEKTFSQEEVSQLIKEREGKYRVENNTEMKLGEVHYSKTGFHVVPYIKKE